MDITKEVAKKRFNYHVTMLDIYNVLNQIGILKDRKAEFLMRNHTMGAFDCLERLGYDLSSIKE